MNALDLVLLLPMLWGAWHGYRKGLAVSVADIVALLLGIWGAIKFSDFTAGLLARNFGLTSQYNSLIAFAVTFVAIVIGVHLLAKVIDRLFHAVALGFVLRLGGALFGAVKYALVLSVLLSLFGALNRNFALVGDDFFAQSLFYGPVSRLAPALFSYFDFDWINQSV